jgi:hypothetical protein
MDMALTLPVSTTGTIKILIALRCPYLSPLLLRLSCSRIERICDHRAPMPNLDIKDLECLKCISGPHEMFSGSFTVEGLEVPASMNAR